MSLYPQLINSKGEYHYQPDYSTQQGQGQGQGQGNIDMGPSYAEPNAPMMQDDEIPTFQPHLNGSPHVPPMHMTAQSGYVPQEGSTQGLYQAESYNVQGKSQNAYAPPQEGHGQSFTTPQNAYAPPQEGYGMQTNGYISPQMTGYHDHYQMPPPPQMEGHGNYINTSQNEYGAPNVNSYPPSTMPYQPTDTRPYSPHVQHVEVYQPQQQQQYYHGLEFIGVYVCTKSNASRDEYSNKIMLEIGSSYYQKNNERRDARLIYDDKTNTAVITSPFTGKEWDLTFMGNEITSVSRSGQRKIFTRQGSIPISPQAGLKFIGEFMCTQSNSYSDINSNKIIIQVGVAYYVKGAQSRELKITFNYNNNSGQMTSPFTGKVWNIYFKGHEVTTISMTKQKKTFSRIN